MTTKESAAYAAILEGLKERRSEISVDGSISDWEALLRGAIARDPRLIMEFTGIRTQGSERRFSYFFKYAEDAPDPSEVTCAVCYADALAALRRAAREYRRKVFVVAGKGLDLDDCARFFLDTNGVAMPLLRSMLTDSTSFSSLPYNKHVFTLKYRLGNTKLQMMKADTEKEARRVASLLFLSDMPAAAKIYLAHNYLCRTVTYQHNAETKLEKASKQCAYGALIEKLCVCQGFAEAFQMLMELGGVDCMLIEGTILSSGGGHAWNLVNPDGRRWSHLDSTWDSDSAHPRNRYAHFCVSDEAYRDKRSWDRNLVPTCDGDAAILDAARKYVRAHRSALLARGVPEDVLDA